MSNKKVLKKNGVEGLQQKIAILWATLTLAETTLYESTLKFKLQKHVKGTYLCPSCEGCEFTNEFKSDEFRRVQLPKELETL